MIAKSLLVKATLTDNLLSYKADLVNKITYTQAEEYDGAYDVTSFLAEPSMTSSLVLPTRDKIMRDNVTVYSVPTSEEYNPQGGVTFTIGG